MLPQQQLLKFLINNAKANTLLILKDIDALARICYGQKNKYEKTFENHQNMYVAKPLCLNWFRHNTMPSTGVANNYVSTLLARKKMPHILLKRKKKKS